MSLRRAAVLAALLAGCATTAERAATADLDDLAPLAPTVDISAPSPALADLDALLAEAYRRSPALRAAFHDADALARAVPASRKLPEPMVTYGLFLRSVETRVGPQNHRVGATQAIPWPGRLRAGADAAARRADVAVRRFEAVRVEIARRVRLPWAELAWLARARALVTEEEALLGDVEVAVRARLAVGGAGFADLQRVGLRRAELREEVAAMGDRAARLAAEVRAAAGLGPDATLPSPTFAVAPAERPPTAALREALAANPRLRVALSEVAARRAEVVAAEAEGRPGLSVGLDWIAVGEARMPGVADSGKDAVVVMAGVQVPLWRGAYRARERSARAGLQAAEARYEQAQLDAEAALTDVLSREDEAARRIALYEADLVPGARAAVESSLSALSASRGSLLDVLDIERQLLGYRLKLARARADRDRARADLDALVGREVSR